MGQLVIDMADIIVTKMTDYLTEKAISSFDNWLRNRKKQHNRVEKKKSESILTCKTRAQQILKIKQTQQTGVTSSKEKANQTPFVEFDNAYKEYRIYMTSEEVQKELIDIFMLSVIRAKKDMESISRKCCRCTNCI
jgi:ribosomal protein S30